LYKCKIVILYLYTLLKHKRLLEFIRIYFQSVFIKFFGSSPLSKCILCATLSTPYILCIIVFIFIVFHAHRICVAETVFTNVTQVDTIHHAPSGVRGQRVFDERQETRLAIQLSWSLVSAPSHRSGPNDPVQHGSSVQPKTVVPKLRHSVPWTRRGGCCFGSVYGITGRYFILYYYQHKIRLKNISQNTNMRRITAGCVIVFRNRDLCFIMYFVCDIFFQCMYALLNNITI